ncbi:MAG: glycosyltransferase [Planctomycetaceae bacterium]|nr:MAG: glycosyltransferase [Planctomycetaceae bacterium]
MSRIHISFVVSKFDMGGYQRIVAHLLNNLDRRRFAASVVCFTTSGSAADWLTVQDVPIVELHKPPRSYWSFPRQLAEALTHQGAHIVHTHNWGTLVETCLARARLSGVKHLHAEHGTVFAGSNASGWRRWVNCRLLRVALARCDHVLAVADDVRRRVVEASGFPARLIEVVRNGACVPPCTDRAAARAEVRGRLGIPHDAFVAGTIARLVEVKALNYAIESLTEPVNPEKPLYLLLVGDGPERQRLERQAHDLGVADRVRFAGQQSVLGPWIAAMDVYINTSLSEGISLSILEAMGWGLPLIATDVGGNSDCTGRDQSCGLLIPSGDVSALKRSLRSLAESPGICEEYARRGRERYLENYSVEIMVNRYEQIYAQLVDSAAVCGNRSQSNGAGKPTDLVRAAVPPAGIERSGS